MAQSEVFKRCVYSMYICMFSHNKFSVANSALSHVLACPRRRSAFPTMNIYQQAQLAVLLSASLIVLVVTEFFRWLVVAPHNLLFLSFC